MIVLSLVWILCAFEFRSLYALFSAIISYISSSKAKYPFKLPLKENKDYYVRIAIDHEINFQGLTKPQLITSIQEHLALSEEDKSRKFLIFIALFFLILSGIAFTHFLKDTTNSIKYASPAENQHQYYEPQAENDSTETEALIFELLDTSINIHIDSFVRIYDSSLVVSFSHKNPNRKSINVSCKNLGDFGVTVSVYRVSENLKDTTFAYVQWELLGLVDPKNLCR